MKEQDETQPEEREQDETQPLEREQSETQPEEREQDETQPLEREQSETQAEALGLGVIPHEELGPGVIPHEELGPDEIQSDQPEQGETQPEVRVLDEIPYGPGLQAAFRFLAQRVFRSGQEQSCGLRFAVPFWLPGAIRFSSPDAYQCDFLSGKEPDAMPCAKLWSGIQFLPPDETRFLLEPLCGLRDGLHSWSERPCDFPDALRFAPVLRFCSLAVPRFGLEQPYGIRVALHSLPEQHCGSRDAQQPLAYSRSLRRVPPSLG